MTSNAAAAAARLHALPHTKKKLLLSLGLSLYLSLLQLQRQRVLPEDADGPTAPGPFGRASKNCKTAKGVPAVPGEKPMSLRQLGQGAQILLRQESACGNWRTPWFGTMGGMSGRFGQ